MAWTVDLIEEFEPEFDALPPSVQDELLAQAKVIEHFGPAAGRPRVDTLKGSRHTNMKELRFDADGGVWRVAFAFDPRRHAVLLVAGDKSGGSEKRFYAQFIAKADQTLQHPLATQCPEEEMTMARTLADKVQELPAARRKKVEARAAELIAEEMSLRDLRKAMNRTQVEVAKTLKVGQDTVSRYEQRSDMLLSTLQGYVQAMGGELDLVVTFPNRKPVKLKSLGEFGG